MGAEPEPSESVALRYGGYLKLVGEFSIVVTGDPTLPGWARVRVHRHRTNPPGIAADVSVTFTNSLAGLPSNANEFLAAVPGVNGGSFLNLL